MCPDCGLPLIILELNGVELDFCTQCGGSWLDQGELELLLQLESCPGEESLFAQHSFHPKGKSTRCCPRCRRAMEQGTLGHNAPVEVEHCRKEHGFWLDRGEIESLVKQYTHGKSGCVAAFFASLYEHELKK